MSVRRRLDDLYARLPPVRCQGLCQEACGPIACTTAEAALMERATGRPLTFDTTTGNCGYLSSDGRCAVYRVRPFVCRAFGASARLPCPFGCVPDVALSSEAEHDLFLRVIDIGGDPVVASPVPPATAQ